MLKIEILCSGCKQHVNVVATSVDALDDFTVYVLPCDNIDCKDCSDCEIEQDNERLEFTIAELEEKIKKEDQNE